MVCAFCRGLGYLGAGDEPGSDRDEHPRPMRPVWEEPVVRPLSFCRMCLGAGKVVHLGGLGEPTGKLIEMPCPACSAREDGTPGP